MNFQALDRLQVLRNHLGRPIILNSAYRSPEHNRRVGGAKSSKHMLAEAFDGRQENQNPQEYLRAAKSAGFLGFGTYPASNFIHVDIGPARSWGEPFPRTASGLPQEVSASAHPPKPASAFAAFFGAIIALLKSIFGGKS